MEMTNTTTQSSDDLMKWIIWLLRIGVFATFVGHGTIAFVGNPKWLPYLATVGITGDLAVNAMTFIGALDILLAISVLIKPLRPVLYWCAFWAFSTALIRPLSGESILAFVERGANWTVPLVLLLLSYRKR
ncbi:hypothetical protein [Reichenbachiella sp. MALMAid0571]|uniref:hypothetical protein n=1 Tax=Reichenbachiella sp. MALMAid0571 TaxID=3143939 RepID=UPI0032DF74B8